MATGDKIETRGHVVGFDEEISSARKASRDAFFTWFDSAKDTDAAFVRGFWDFSLHIAVPIAEYVSVPEKKVALDIGHGGGRILTAAAKHFKRVVGVDVHSENDMVSGELERRGVSNFELHKTDGRSLPVADSSIDVVYSFIVLQHVERISVFNRYVEEAFRVLKPGGVAVLYFGRAYRFSINRDSRLLLWLDRIYEKAVLGGGFKEFPARVNDTNLRVSLSYAKALGRRIGFEVCKTLVSRKNVPDGAALYGGQNGLVLRKPQ